VIWQKDLQFFEAYDIILSAIFQIALFFVENIQKTIRPKGKEDKK